MTAALIASATGPRGQPLGVYRLDWQPLAGDADYLAVAPGLCVFSWSVQPVGGPMPSSTVVELYDATAGAAVLQCPVAGGLRGPQSAPGAPSGILSLGPSSHDLQVRIGGSSPRPYGTLRVTAALGPPGAAGPYESKFGFSASPIGSQLIHGDCLTRFASYPADFAGSAFRCDAAPASNWVAPVRKNGAQVGTLTVPASSQDGTFSTGGTIVLLGPGDYLEIFAPASADGSIARGYGTLAGTR